MVMTSHAQDRLHLGFLTAIKVPDRGVVGGLLITNRFGRPLEFQCTTPVKANRSQEILYGPTLEPYLLCELIGTTLVQKVGVKPDVVLIDDERLLELRRHIDLPLVALSARSGEGQTKQAADAAEQPAADAPVECGGVNQRYTLRFHSSFSADEQLLTEKDRLIPRDANLLEPFDRVREALREAVDAACQKNVA